MKSERFAIIAATAIVVGAFMFFAASANRGRLYSDTHPAAKTPVFGPLRGKQLVFSDEFSGKSLDTKKWSTCYDWKKPAETGCTNGGNFEQQWYSDNQLHLSDGNLVITATHKPVDVAVGGTAKTFPYQSGMLNSGRGGTAGSEKWTGTYGYYEARISVPKGQGIWPAFWLLPSDGNWPPEIDAMEYIGSSPNQILQTVHWPAANGPQKDTSAVAQDVDFSQQWHTYGIDWQPDSIDWYIDGVKTKSFRGPETPAKPMEIIVNLAVGGVLPGNADATTPLPAIMRVDYVRVYQSKNSAASNTAAGTR